VHKAAAVNSQLLDRVVAAAVNSQLPLDKAPAGEPAAVVEPVKQEAAVAAAAADNQLTLPRQTLETFARFFITGAGIWACCAAIRKSI
jgi:hypothetical protein